MPPLPRRSPELEPALEALLDDLHPDSHGLWAGLASGVVAWAVLASRTDFAFVLALLVAIGVAAVGATELLIMRRSLLGWWCWDLERELRARRRL
jgi:hypothetical protein